MADSTWYASSSATRPVNSVRNGGRATAGAPSACAARTSGNRRSVRSRRPRNASCATVVATSRFSVEPSSASSGMASTPPTRNPSTKPDTTRGNSSFIWRTSSSRPACPPRNTKPTWMAIGNITSRTADTHSPPATRITHDAANSSAMAPRLTVATRTRRAPRAARAMRAAAPLPTTAIAM